MLKLPENITMAELIRLDLLKNPESYVRDVWKNCLNFKKQHEGFNANFRVRLGLSGRGSAPNYRIEFETRPDVSYTDQEASDHFRGIKNHVAFDYLAAKNTAFSGVGHREKVSGLIQENWSTATEGENEIREILQIYVNGRKSASG